MCKAEGCNRLSRTSYDLCVMHYKRLKRNGTLDRVIAVHNPDAVCSHCGAAQKLTKGFCHPCYTRYWRKGYVERDIAPQGSGTTDSNGYRVITVGGKRVYEHRHMMGAKSGEVVHHKAERSNNNGEYLHIFASQSEHAAHHVQLRKVDTLKKED